METISKRIYDKRKELDMTMEELANRIGVTKSTISKWEKGYVDNIKSSNIVALSHALRVTPVWLMGMEENNSEISSTLHLKAPVKDSDEEKIQKSYYNFVKEVQQQISVENVEKEIEKLNVSDLKRLIKYIDYQIYVKEENVKEYEF